MTNKNGKSRSNWRDIHVQRNQEDEVELPSGLVVISRKPDMLDFVLGGEVPNSFFGEMMNEMMKMNGTSTTGQIDIDVDALTPDTLKGLVDLSGNMMIACCTDPLIWDGPTVIKEGGDGSEDRMGIGDIGASDKMAYFTWATGDADALKTFRQQTGRSRTNAPAGKRVRAKAK